MELSLIGLRFNIILSFFEQHQIFVGKRCGFVQFDNSFRTCAEEALMMLNGSQLAEKVEMMVLMGSCMDWKSRPKIPEIHLPEDPFLQIAAGLRIEINMALTFLREIASRHDLKKFHYMKGLMTLFEVHTMLHLKFYIDLTVQRLMCGVLV
ncbi:hypothetical protein MKW98_006315 [Papaver atlanticum]|uniref:RRM domain-containing protein n=1 Tax=Papaver atlanticum TaxID=357466 RepID=A0AAD4XW98_9MAGN|nr:hypothetical protein MKW98_006315 [Papaver atlanticum]